MNIITIETDLGLQINLGDRVKATIKGKWAEVEGIVAFNKTYGLVCIVDENNRPFGSDGSSTNYKPYLWNTYTNIQKIST